MEYQGVLGMYQWVGECRSRVLVAKPGQVVIYFQDAETAVSMVNQIPIVSE
jgi:hypothetical protein